MGFMEAFQMLFQQKAARGVDQIKRWILQAMGPGATLNPSEEAAIADYDLAQRQGNIAGMEHTVGLGTMGRVPPTGADAVASISRDPASNLGFYWGGGGGAGEDWGGDTGIGGGGDTGIGGQGLTPLGQGLTVGSAQLPSPPAFGVPAEWADPGVYAGPYNIWSNIRAGQNPYDPRLSTMRDYTGAISRGYNPAAGRYMLSPKDAVPGQGSFAEFIVNPGERSSLESLRDRFGALAAKLSLRAYDPSLLGGRWGDFFDYNNKDIFDKPGGKSRLGQNLVTALMAAIGGPAFFNSSLKNSLESRWELFSNSDPTQSGMNAARAFADWGASQIGRQQPTTIGGGPMSQMPMWQQGVGGIGGMNRVAGTAQPGTGQRGTADTGGGAGEDWTVRTIDSLTKKPGAAGAATKSEEAVKAAMVQPQFPNPYTTEWGDFLNPAGSSINPFEDEELFSDPRGIANTWAGFT